ncbi:hypothetical protein, partial [Bacteroides bouchesdurhonensis]|uniref:hypothetical protein n=1 Tax=Bacteroides bouchesdurhonensis TaxID=1841855 RepID=UPI0022DFA406
YGEGTTLAANTDRFNEQVTGYDKMGNILGLKRYGQTAASTYGLIDHLALTYNGNRCRQSRMWQQTLSMGMVRSLKTAVTRQ